MRPTQAQLDDSKARFMASWFTPGQLATNSYAQRYAALPATLFQQQLASVGACRAAREWVGNKTAREAYNTCTRSAWLCWVLESLGGLSWGDTNPVYNLTPAEVRAKFPFETLRNRTAKRAQEGK